MRALSFGINDISGVSGFAKPGDHVDILLISSQDGKNRVTSKMLLRDVLLLAINKSSMGQGYVAPKKDDKDGKDESNGNKNADCAASHGYLLHGDARCRDGRALAL